MRQDLERIASLVAKQRKYAGFFQWGDKGSVEHRVAVELCLALERANLETLANPTSSIADPPDVVCLDPCGRSVAVEIVEAVSQEAAHANAKGREVYRDWRPGEFAKHVEALVLGEDAKSLHGGPYSRYIVCVFTDEPAVDVPFATSQLALVRLAQLRQISAAYLLMSYDPHSGGYPVLKVPLPHNTPLERTREG
jgi:hypothetical protein